MKKNYKGFTLIELLVVIAIIGLLSTLAVVALGNARQKSRDARRMSDVKQVQTALELYLNDCSGYPDGVTSGNSITGPGTCGGTTYMAIVPSNPTPNGITYTYNLDSPSTYSFQYNLEGTTGGVAAGTHTATPAGIQDD